MNNRHHQSTGPAQLEPSGRVPLEVLPTANRNLKQTVSNFFTCKAALRWYIITLLICNMVIGAMILGSLQQLYRSINTLTESFASATLDGTFNSSRVEIIPSYPKHKK